MEPIVIVEGDDLVRLMEVLAEITDEFRPGIYRLRFAIDGGIKIKANEGVWTIDYGRVEIPARDLCPRCGGDHDRIDRRDPCSGEMRITLDGVEVGRGIPEGQAPYAFWHRVRVTTGTLTVPASAKAHYDYVPDGRRSTLVDLAPAYRLEPIREGES
jgi:hypothetical protein